MLTFGACLSPRDQYMAYSLDQHCLQGARFLESPNQSARPEGTAISLLVIHNISLPPGEFGTDCVPQFFCNTLDCSSHPYFDGLRDMQVSSHLFIDRAGAVIQFVPFNRKAWHAGVSRHLGRENCNDFSIGIELEGTDSQAYTDPQYETLEAVTRILLEEYPELTVERIVGHSDIAPGRKTDPGPGFDWSRYRLALSS